MFIRNLGIGLAFMLTLLVIEVPATELTKEQALWTEVKDSKNIELLKFYTDKYPTGTFTELADYKIKQLRNIRINSINQSYTNVQTYNNSNNSKVNIIPEWVIDKGSTKYENSSFGSANKHFRGKQYSIKLAKKRALREFPEVDNIEDIETKYYVDENGKASVLLYIND